MFSLKIECFLREGSSVSFLFPLLKTRGTVSLYLECMKIQKRKGLQLTLIEKMQYLTQLKQLYPSCLNAVAMNRDFSF